MLRRAIRLGLALGVLGVLGLVLLRVLGGRRPQPVGGGLSSAPLPPTAWPPLEPDHSLDAAANGTALEPDPEAPAPAPATAAAKKAKATATPVPSATWVEPTGDVCPSSHPVKGKLGSKIFHLPGMLNYDRTKPDRCYRDGEAAEGDGLRAAKR